MAKKGFSWRVQQERGPVPTAATSSSQRAGALASRRLKGASCRHSRSYTTHPQRVAWIHVSLTPPGSALGPEVGCLFPVWTDPVPAFSQLSWYSRPWPWKLPLVYT